MSYKYLFMRFPEGKYKAVTLSYDDGSRDDVRLLETINRYGLKCTFNLMGGKVEKESSLSKEFIKEQILGKGHEIANHGYDHRAQNRIRPIEGIRDIVDCRIALENAFGGIVRGMAFPDCSINRFTEPDTYKRVKAYLQELDIAYVRSAGGDNDKFNLPEDWYNWMPTAHHDNPLLMEYIDRFVDLDPSKLYCAARTPKLFYLWGHSFEFERNNNWDRLEEICQRLSGKSDVWYATNIEIYDYVQAFRSLIYSADGAMVYNPTLFDIWFRADKTLYCIHPGQTLRIGD
ncbi:MAG: polysaccharide deacetylase family protein [Clostridia bacterium]|nr:polysaccharide deacetylase family protein [Clostridia bacterium]